MDVDATRGIGVIHRQTLSTRSDADHDDDDNHSNANNKGTIV